MVQRRRKAAATTSTPSSPPRRDRHQRARLIQPRGHQEVPLQRRRSSTPTPQTEHGVVHRNHRKSAQPTRRRRARARPRPQTRHNPRVDPRKLRRTRAVHSGTAYRSTKTLHLFSCFSF